MVLTALTRFACLPAPLALVTLAALQSPAPDAQQPLPAADPKAAAAVAPAPGVLPADTSDEARATWNALVEALRPKAAGSVAAPITAFDLSIMTRVTTGESGNQQKNDLEGVRYQYLAPDFVCTIIGGIKRMHAPDGDWLWDPEKGDLVRLAGKDFEQDRRELAQTLALARNYLALAEPGRLRIARLERLKAPPDCLPRFDPTLGPAPKDSVLSRAASLEWIAITSPDFRVVEALKGEQNPMFLAQLGLDPKSHLPLLATIWQDQDGTMAPETAVLVDFAGASSYTLIDERRVPNYFRVHDPLLPSSPFAFQGAARMEVVIKKGSTLRPGLTAADFHPPKK